MHRNYELLYLLIVIFFLIFFNQFHLNYCFNFSIHHLCELLSSTNVAVCLIQSYGARGRLTSTIATNEQFIEYLPA